MKKLVLLNAAFALNLFVAHTHAALPQGLESVNVRATLNIQNGRSVKTASFSNRDLLTIIQNQFGVSIPNGSQLVMRGLGASPTNQFLVWNPSQRTNVIANASSDGVSAYALFFMPDNNRFVVNQRGGSAVNDYTFSQADFHYNNAANTASFDLFGLTTATVNYGNNNENFNMKSGAGPFTLIPGGGVITGSMNGTGKSVAVPFPLPTPVL